MKKSITLIMTLLMVLGLCSSAMAVPKPMGLSREEIINLITPPKYYTNYRDIDGPLGDATLKPKAQFGVQVGSQSEVYSTVTNNYEEVNSVTMTAGQTAIINPYSSSPTGRSIVNYDFQYRIVPDGKDRLSQPIVYNYYCSWPAVQAAFAKAIQDMQALGSNAELELYLCVSDGQDNWSANGNTAVSKKDNIFKNGIIWYFSGMALDYKVGGPDFYPLSWGATQYQESFKDCAMTYTADAGTAMNVPISINNSGTQAITDMAATWYGTGWSNPVYTQKDLNIPQGGKQDIQIPVTVPQIGQETRLVIQANTDGKTPASEGNQDNNMMIIKVGPIIPFTDVSVSASANSTNPYNMENSIVTFVITNNGPAVADVTFSAGRMANGDWTITNGGKTQNYTLQPGESQNMTYDTASFSAGTSIAYGGIAVVTNTTDSNPNNNMDRVTVTWKARPQPINLGPGSSDGYLSY